MAEGPTREPPELPLPGRRPFDLLRLAAALILAGAAALIATRVTLCVPDAASEVRDIAIAGGDDDAGRTEAWLSSRIDEALGDLRARGDWVLSLRDPEASEQTLLTETPLPPSSAWVLRDASGRLLDSAGIQPLLPFPTEAEGDTAEINNGLLWQRLVRLESTAGDLVFVGGVTVSHRDIALLSGVPRASLTESLESRRVRRSVPPWHLGIDACALAILACLLFLSLPVAARLRPRRGWTAMFGATSMAAICVLSTSPLLPLAQESSFASNLPWLPYAADPDALTIATLLTRLVPGSTPLSFLFLGLALLFLARQLSRATTRAGPSRSGSGLLLSLGSITVTAVLIWWLLATAIRGMTATSGLVLFDPHRAFSTFSTLPLETGALALAVAFALLVAALARALVKRITGKAPTLSTLPALLLLGVLGALLVVFLVFRGGAQHRTNLLLSYAGTDERARLQQLAFFAERSVEETFDSPEVIEAIERGDLDRAALLAWSTTSLAGQSVPARIWLEDLARGQSAIILFDLPPRWLPDPERTANNYGHSFLPRPWSVEISIPLTKEPLVPQSTLELLASARRPGSATPIEILRASADAGGVILPGTDLPAGAPLPPAVLEGAATGDWQVGRLSWAGRRFLVSAAILGTAVAEGEPPGEPRDDLAVVAVEAPPALDLLVRALRSLLICLGGCLLYLVGLTVLHGTSSASRRRTFLGRFDVRVTLAAACVALVPLAIVSFVAPRIAELARREAVERRLLEAPAIARAYLSSSLDDLAAGIDNGSVRELASALGLDVSVYNDGELSISSRPELAALSLVTGRASPEAVHALEDGTALALVSETLGALQVPTVYAPLTDRMLVSASILVGAADIDRATAPAVARLQVFIFAVMALVAAVAAAVTLRITAPVRALTRAADRVAGGDLDATVDTNVSRAVGTEIAELVMSFEHMIAELRDSRERLIAAEKDAAWSEMARQVAHEIKNPLTPIRLSIQHLSRAHGDGAADFDEILERVSSTVLSEIDALTRIAEDFSDFARFPQRERVPVDLGEITREVAHLYTGDRNVVVEVADDLPAVSADPQEIRRVLVNLIKNALEATEGQPDPVVSLSVGSDPTNRPGIVLLSVTDNGPGIPDDIRPRLFEPYFSTKTGGTGLGLAIVSRAIEGHGGTVSAWAAEGGGTVFEVTLPVLPDPEQA